MPLERIFFDTNIICNIRWLITDPTFEDGFYDYKSQKFINMHEELRADCVALRWLVDKDDEFSLQFVTSKHVLKELLKTQNSAKRGELEELFQQLDSHFKIRAIDYLEESDLPPLEPGDEGLSAQLLARGYLDFLPQLYDRLLVVEALRMQCHVFLTTDRKTIWDYRKQLSRLGINVQRPWEYVSNLVGKLSPGNIGLLPYGNLEELLRNTDR